MPIRAGWLVHTMLSSDVAPRPKRLRSAALLIALSLGAAACGAADGDSVAAPTLAPAVESGAAEGNSSDGDSSAASDGSGSEAPADAPSADPAVNLFPDVDVLNVSDGSTLNLAAELGGGDKATLLWFWAPH